MKTKRILLYFLMLFTLSTVCTMGANAAKTNIDNVCVGYYNIPGYHNQTENGERNGYGYDFLQLLRRYWKVEFAYTGYDLSWTESMAMLQSGKIDLLTGALRT